MTFRQEEAEKLLADTGRRCCLCGSLHNVQLHHIVPDSDDIDDAIPLCPSCHNEVHGSNAPGRTTRAYTPNELKLHRQRTIEQVQKERQWAPGTSLWQEDRDLILFYSQCLDRPAFRTRFHQEMSFSAFDKAMEDTLIALNTGYWRTRDGALIDRAKGKAYLTHKPWRENMDRVVAIIEDIRRAFHEAVGFNRMLLDIRHRGAPADLDILMGARFRQDIALGKFMDSRREEAIKIMNAMLQEIGHQPLHSIEEKTLNEPRHRP